MIPFCGGSRGKHFIRASLGWLATISAFLVCLFYLELNVFNLILIPYPSATSIDVERLFSKGRLVLSHVRNRLSAGTTRELLCLNNWIGQGLVQLDDLKEAASLPEVLNDCPGEEQDELDMVL